MSEIETIEDADLVEEGAEDAPQAELDVTKEQPLVLDAAQRKRVAEALIFAAESPITIAKLAEKFGPDVDVSLLIAELQQDYEGKGIELVSVSGGYAFRTATDVASLLRGDDVAAAVRKPPRAATETLAIIAYHQPVTRAEIEAIRGVQVSRGTLDILMESGWVRPGKRRETPGRPLTWHTTPQFLEHFGLTSLRDLPGVEELRQAGLLDAKPVLATLPAEPEFEGEGSVPADGFEDTQNDMLPAGDEGDDFNAPTPVSAESDDDFTAEADDEDDDADEDGSDDEDSDSDESDDDADEDFDDEDEDEDDLDDEDEDEDETEGRYAAE